MADLYLEVSNMLQWTLEGKEIEHTKTEISFLRRRILEISAKEGINQENYNIKEHQISIQGTVYHEIDNFYKTRLADSIAKSLLPYDYRGLP
jgi:hypothetical protein